MTSPAGGSPEPMESLWWLLPLALALFLLVPRLPPFGLLPGGWGAAAVTGLSDTLEPGAIAALSSNSAPAARVTFATGEPPSTSARR